MWVQPTWLGPGKRKQAACPVPAGLWTLASAATHYAEAWMGGWGGREGSDAWDPKDAGEDLESSLNPRQGQGPTLNASRPSDVTLYPIPARPISLPTFLTDPGPRNQPVHGFFSVSGGTSQTPPAPGCEVSPTDVHVLCHEPVASCCGPNGQPVSHRGGI